MQNHFLSDPPSHYDQKAIIALFLFWYPSLIQKQKYFQFSIVFQNSYLFCGLEWMWMLHKIPLSASIHWVLSPKWMYNCIKTHTKMSTLRTIKLLIIYIWVILKFCEFSILSYFWFGHHLKIVFGGCVNSDRIDAEVCGRVEQAGGKPVL